MNRRIRALFATTARTAPLCAKAPVRGSRRPHAARAIRTTESPNASHTFWPMTRRVVSARPMSLRQASEIGPEESHVGAAKGHLVELGADGHTDVGAAEGRRIVDSIADHHDGPARGLLGAHDFELLGGEDFGNDFIHAECLPNFTSNRGAVSGEQDQAVDSQGSHGGKRIPRLAAGLIAQHRRPRHRPP